MKYTKKLIEVALPLDAINEASVREKSIRHGHPSTLHLWWARRPLATARAVIFAQMVDDPSEYVAVLLSDLKKKRAAEHDLRQRLAKRTGREIDGDSEASEGPVPTLEDVITEHERDRLFKIIRALVKWENTTNEAVLQMARDEIRQSWRRACAKNADHPEAAELFNRHNLPGFHDPFAGGGSLPLEAQRLGLETFASDLNPVAVLINKAMIEIPSKFIGKPPVNPESRTEENPIPIAWEGVQGLIEDINSYGRWMRNEAEKCIGHLYPKIEITTDITKTRQDLEPYLGQRLTIVAWIWTRTVRSPNPAFSKLHVPLVSTFMLSTKKSKEAYVEPIIEDNHYRFSVRTGMPPDLISTSRGTKSTKGANFICLMSKAPISSSYIKQEGIAGRMGTRLMAIVAEGNRGRIYLSPHDSHQEIAHKQSASWSPKGSVPRKLTGGTCFGYGLTEWSDLFTERQLVALTTFADLVKKTHIRIKEHINHIQSNWKKNSSNTTNHLTLDYANSIAVYLAISVDKSVKFWSTLCTWNVARDGVVSAFSRQALPIAWDFVEANPFSNSSGNFLLGIKQVTDVLRQFKERTPIGQSIQSDAKTQHISHNRIISTDPPYYDNISYADLSDFFYVWLRHSLREFYPELFATINVPKSEELVASRYRHGGAKSAKSFFLSGMTETMRRLSAQGHMAFPVTIYYAFKQSQSSKEGETPSTGWETFLEALIRAGYSITGTWPVRTERVGNFKKYTASLASSIVLVCRPRLHTMPTITRATFVSILKNELPTSLQHLQRCNIAPVDLAQAAIGPGMAIFTRYSRILDAAGIPVSVRQSLSLINQVLDELLVEQDSEYDAASRWALAWFEQNGFNEGDYGTAEILSTAKNTSVASLSEAEILELRAGTVRLLRPEQLPSDWKPDENSRPTIWEIVHHLIRILAIEGETGASEVVRRLVKNAEITRELCYRLYTLCERKKWLAESMSYNSLVKSWPEIELRARARPVLRSGEMFGERK